MTCKLRTACCLRKDDQFWLLHLPQATAWSMQWLLLPLVPRNEKVTINPSPAAGGDAVCTDGSPASAVAAAGSVTDVRPADLHLMETVEEDVEASAGSQFAVGSVGQAFAAVYENALKRPLLATSL
jgi:hypothetical protein